MKNQIFAFAPPYIGEEKSHFTIFLYHFVENIVNIYEKRK